MTPGDPSRRRGACLHVPSAALTRLSIALVVAVSLVAAAAAQDGWRQWGQRFRRAPPRFPNAASFDGSFNFCRLYYNQVRRHQSGSGWSTDYPDADANFTVRLSELTKTRVSRQPGGEPNYLVVPATDDALFKCPFLLMEDAGAAGFSDIEVTRLREYLLKGGFLWVDDFWGSAAWAHWREQIGRVLDPLEYPIQELPMTDPIFSSLFQIAKLPQITNIQFWRRSGGTTTSERGWDSEDVQLRAIRDAHGRIMVLMTHNNDVADSWEREGEDPAFFYQFSPDGYALGLNVLIYAMSH